VASLLLAWLLRWWVLACSLRYLHWVGCPNELPPTMSAYKTQQYRWNSGPMVVIKQLVSTCSHYYQP
jgi:hypothetical protein